MKINDIENFISLWKIKNFIAILKSASIKKINSLSKLKSCYEKWQQQLREWMYWQVIFLEKYLYSGYIRNSEFKNHTIQ